MPTEGVYMMVPAVLQALTRGTNTICDEFCGHEALRLALRASWADRACARMADCCDMVVDWRAVTVDCKPAIVTLDNAKERALVEACAS